MKNGSDAHSSKVWNFCIIQFTLVNKLIASLEMIQNYYQLCHVLNIEFKQTKTTLKWLPQPNTKQSKNVTKSLINYKSS